MNHGRMEKLHLQIQTLTTGDQPDHCVVMLEGLVLEMPVKISVSATSQKVRKKKQDDGTLLMDLEADCSWQEIDADREGKASKNTTDYEYFRRQYPRAVVMAVQAEVFNYRKKEILPCTVNKLSISFKNHETMDYTDRISVTSLD